MKTGGFKQQLFEQFAIVGKALSNANRLELLEFLAQGERSVEPLAKLANLSMANASQHLQVLRQAGLVTARKKGQHVFYSLAGDSVVSLLTMLRSIAEKNLAEVNRLINTYLGVKDDLEPVSAQELLKRAGDGLVTVLDVRPKEEYEAGHIPGAINVALRDLENYVKQINADNEVVAYCRGPYCVLAFEAVEKLREKGVKAKRLEYGMPEWKAAGLPVDAEGEEE